MSTKIIVRRIEDYLEESENPQGFWDIYYHLNTFRNGTTHNQLTKVMRKPQFIQVEYKKYTMVKDD